MDKIVNFYVKKFKERRRKKRQKAMLLSTPALFLVIVVCWQLHLTGIALTNETGTGSEAQTNIEEIFTDLPEEETADASPEVSLASEESGDESESDAERNGTAGDPADVGVVYTADAVDEGGIAVTVTALESELPEGAELSVTLFDETSEEYVGSVNVSAGRSLTLTAANNYTGTTAGYELPETGGSGTWLYILTGLLLSGTAISLLYRRRKRA